MDSAYANGGKSQAYKFYTPFSSSEYFVVEYRKPGKKYSADLDQNMSGAGLIVYRVNPAYATDGNLRGNDYIYVFRPDDTGGNASAGDITKAAAGCRPTYPADSLSDRRICQKRLLIMPSVTVTGAIPA